MKLISAECPNFNIDENKEKCFCMYCGSVILVQNENPKTSKVQNHEFEAKFTLAQNMERVFFMSGAVNKDGKTGFNAVLAFYGAVEEVGGNNSDYWFVVARFWIKGSLQELQKGTLNLNSRQKFIDFYNLYMDNAIKFCESDTSAIENEKNRTLQMLTWELNKYPEKNPGSPYAVIQKRTNGCYIATAVYGSYDCPQVWTLRRF